MFHNIRYIIFAIIFIIFFKTLSQFSFYFSGGPWLLLAVLDGPWLLLVAPWVMHRVSQSISPRMGSSVLVLIRRKAYSRVTAQPVSLSAPASTLRFEPWTLH